MVIVTLSEQADWQVATLGAQAEPPGSPPVGEIYEELTFRVSKHDRTEHASKCYLDALPIFQGKAASEHMIASEPHKIGHFRIHCWGVNHLEPFAHMSYICQLIVNSESSDTSLDSS